MSDTANSYFMKQPDGTLIELVEKRWLDHAEQRTRDLTEAATEVWESLPATFDKDDAMVVRHARALNDLGRMLERNRREARAAIEEETK